MDEEPVDILEHSDPEELKSKTMELHQGPFTLCNSLIKE
jgi:hypothetical protein